MILHLLTDEKFSDYVVEQFSAKEMCSDFILVSDTLKMTYFHYIDKVRVINYAHQRELNQLLNLISQYDAVIFHGLFEPWQEWLLRQRPTDVKVAWCVWGGEIYSRPDLINFFLSPITKVIARYRQITHKVDNTPYMIPRDLFKEIDYCLTCVDEEYLYCKNLLKANFKHLWYTYYSLSEMIGSLMTSRCEGNNIWLGNSATIENNHFDALLKLKRVGIGNRKIIAPLSYGYPWARNACIRVGRFLFGNRFHPLADYLPREEYNRMMLSCAVMIQAHLREQAHGNIVTGLWLGMRVYLSENGMEYNHFKRIGCKVYSIETDLKHDNPKVLEPLSKEDVAHNRKVLLSVYGLDHIDVMNREIVKELVEHEQINGK